MKGAKELNIILDQLAMQAAIAPAKVGVHIERIRELFIPELDRLAAIDSAGLGVVGEIAARCAAGLAGENILQAVHDIKTLLAIVQRQAGDLVRATEIVDERIAETEKWHAKWKQVMAERVADQVEIERLQNVSERARAELDRLAESLRMMQHGETEALKMIATEKQRADELAVDSGLANIRIRQLQDQLKACESSLESSHAALLTANASILKLRAEATEQRELAEKEREFGNVAHANGQRLQRLVDVLSSGIAAYRDGGYTQAQLWENGEGKAVPR